MAVTTVSQSSIKEGLDKFPKFTGGFNPIFTDFESIQTITVGSGGASVIEFSSIPQTYQHLQIRCLFSHATANVIDDTRWRWNSDSTVANYYTTHQLKGDGASATAIGFNPGVAYSYLGFHGSNSSFFTSIIVDILDYSNNSKNKVMRSFGGCDQNGSGNVILRSSLWMSTAPITSIRIDLIQPGNFSQHTSFALYGVKAP